LMSSGKKLCITPQLDWFDVGYAIGSLILERCQLEDAFFIGSLLEAPLEQLRSRGFPVDRIIHERKARMAPPPPPPPPPPPAAVPPANTKPNPSSVAPSPAAAPPSPPIATKEPSPATLSSSGMEEILQQMFPDCLGSYIHNQLGKNPSIDDVKALADQMATKGYPEKDKQTNERKDNEQNKDKDDATIGTTNSAENDENDFLPPDLVEAKKPKSKKLGRRLGKALSGIRSNVRNNNNMGNTNNGIGNQMAAPPPSGSSSQDNGLPVSPETDSSCQHCMEQMLQQAVQQSTKVPKAGINSSDKVLTQLPEELSRGDEGCEVIPSQNLKPFPGPYQSGKSHNGIRVFATRHRITNSTKPSEQFLQQEFHAVDSFADILQNLCGIYKLNLSSVCIYYDNSGGTIAFNSNKALYFNVRFYYALHYNEKKQKTTTATLSECYSYWFTTMAHELAHHLVSAHNKEHGFYTESYITLYMPRLMKYLSQQAQS